MQDPGARRAARSPDGVWRRRLMMRRVGEPMQSTALMVLPLPSSAIAR